MHHVDTDPTLARAVGFVYGLLTPRVSLAVAPALPFGQIRPIVDRVDLGKLCIRAP